MINKNKMFRWYFIIVCIGAIVLGVKTLEIFYSPPRAIAHSILRYEALTNSSGHYEGRYLTQKDLNDVPERIAEGYTKAVTDTNKILTQRWKNLLLMVTASLALLITGIVGLFSTRANKKVSHNSNQ